MSTDNSPATFSMSSSIGAKDFDVDQAFEDAQAFLAVSEFAKAEALCHKIISKDAQHSRAWHVLGFLALQQGQSKRARELLEKSIDLGNDNPLMFMHLGISRSVTNDHEGAVDALNTAIEKLPELAPAHFNLGLSLKKTEDLQGAAAAFRATLKLTPDQVDAWVELGTVVLEMAQSKASDDMEGALQAFDKALALDAEHIGALNQKSLALQYLNRMPEAEALMRKAVELAPERPELCLNLGDCLLFTDGEGAIEAYRKALAQDPAFPGAKTRLALALERMKHTDEASALATQILDRDPQDFQARLALVRCELRRENLDWAQAHIDSVDMKALNPKDFVNAQKLKSLILNGKGNFAGAFKAAQLGNQRQLDTLPPHAKTSQDMYDRLQTYQTAFTAERVSEWSTPGHSAYADPVFFVGFPRSGTTLMEQILKVHPNLVAGGENDWLKSTLEVRLPNYPEGLDDLTDAKVEEIRATYWKNVENRIGDRANGKRLIDKMPLNILYLGFIRRIFPQAKILVAIRDPRDCVLSAFMQNFQRSTYMDEFLTLESAARFYETVTNIWLQGKDKLGLDVFEYRYEDLVTNTRSMMEDILSFLGEPFDDAVCSHHTHMDANETIATPSALDVSQAIFTRSRNRWTDYKTELSPVTGILSKSINALGYPVS
ncbi:MAG: sulfotransferase [Magnetovibrio sp.]|nr:sulfotransferase [Magnetovibrio sp.]